ncbi:MAG TPA: hypothetical protein VGW38_07940 [Chloroflexota bacterium]|nr:hypothetical protein [Chloroflexota bacterium]
MNSGFDPALKFILAVAIVASLVMVGLAGYFFSRGETSNGLLLVVIVLIGYAAMGLAWTARRTKR